MSGIYLPTFPTAIVLPSSLSVNRPRDGINSAFSRGIGLVEAKALLVKAYVGDVISSVDREEVRNEILRLYSERHGWT